MRFTRCLSAGLDGARRHPRLVVIHFMVSFAPALLLVIMAGSSMAPALDRSLHAERVLEGEWFAAWPDFAASRLNHLDPVLGSGVLLALLVAVALQVVAAAGTVEVLIERRLPSPTPFLSGVAAHSWRFARCALWFAASAAVALGLALGVRRLFDHLAESASDGRLDLVGWAAAGLTLFLLLAPLTLGYDLARIAAARHHQASMLRGFLRGVWTVLRRPALFLPLALAFVLVPLTLHLVFAVVRDRWTPATAAAVAALVAAQQLVMLLRAVLKVTFCGAEVAAYEGLGAPELCRRRGSPV